MSTKREVLHIWTCDACGHVETVDDSGSGYPSSWRKIVVGRMPDQLGNIADKHLCEGCANGLALLLDGRLGDLGDLAEAWDEGARRCDKAWHANEAISIFDRNPYRQPVEDTAGGEQP